MPKTLSFESDAPKRSTALFGQPRHFRQISRKYRELRTLDQQPMDAILARMPENDGRLNCFDMGCGTGRYTETLLKMMLERMHGSNINFMLVDRSGGMLETAKMHLRKIRAILSFAEGGEDTLLKYRDFFDFGITTNAIHHFNIPYFLGCSALSLKKGGRLFVYTRTQEQNASGIWGLYFPEFAERETRLLSEGQMQTLVNEHSGLRLAETIDFTFERTSTMRMLMDKAMGKHYSTFEFYTPGEFKAALRQFASSLGSDFHDWEGINYFDRNVLYVIEKK